MRTINIGAQGFERIRKADSFYVDKTSFIKEWWENEDDVTLITRPRRFGKTLNLDMLNCFFSNQYENRSDLFAGLDIWKEEKYRNLQGTYPVIFISFANVKERTFNEARRVIIRTLQSVFYAYKDIWENEHNTDRYVFLNLNTETPDGDAAVSLLQFCEYLRMHYNKKVLILLDEYDTPLQEAYVNGYWDEMSSFMRSLFNSTFKTNPSLERGLMTGITRVSKESIFSDLNNLKVVTTTSRDYETSFGFTQDEVDASLKEYNLFDQRKYVQRWYDGFTFGNAQNIYNPWSILNFLDSDGKFQPYWANTSGNALISYELRVSGNPVKIQMEDLLNDKVIQTLLDEQIIFSQLETNPKAIWSLFLASGYLKTVSVEFDGLHYIYSLALTNLEVKLMFEELIALWFADDEESYSGFMRALVHGEAELTQTYLNEVLHSSVSFYDTASYVSETNKPERFYHGLVLGMIAQERNYRISSNRESGLGRYDIEMMPLSKDKPGIIIEFKVFNPNKEKTMEETAERALKQIIDRKYDADLINNGIKKENILHYGMAFSGKNAVVHMEKQI